MEDATLHNSDTENSGNAEMENSEPADAEPVEDKVEVAIPPRKRFRSPKKSAPTRIRRPEDARISEAYNILKSRAGQCNKDDSGAFGDYVAEKLRKMSPRVRATVQQQMSTILFNAEMNELVQPSFSDTLTTIYSSPSPSSSYTLTPLQSPTDSAEPTQPLMQTLSPHTFTNSSSPHPSCSSTVTQSPLQSPTDSASRLNNYFSTFSNI